MPTVSVVVIDKGTDQLDGVSLTEDDSMIEHLPSACADPAFGHRILPWAAVGRSTGLGAHRLDEPDDILVEDRVAVEDEVLGSRVEREGFTKLLHDLLRCRVVGRVEVKDVPAPVVDDEEHVEHAQPDRRHGEEIHASDGVLVVAQEGDPTIDYSGIWDLP